MPVHCFSISILITSSWKSRCFLPVLYSKHTIRNSILTGISIILDILSEFICNHNNNLLCYIIFNLILCIFGYAVIHKHLLLAKISPKHFETILNYSIAVVSLSPYPSLSPTISLFVFKVSCYPHVLTLSMCFKSEMNYLMVFFFSHSHSHLESHIRGFSTLFACSSRMPECHCVDKTL